MDPLVWSFLFCFLMIVAVVLEMLTVTMGLLTLLALGMLAASVVMAFRSSPTTGYVMAAVNLVLFPASIFAAMRLLRKGPLTHDYEIQAGLRDAPAAAKPIHELVGQEGQALTMLRPAGTAQFGERRVDVMTEGKFVDPGSKVKVLRVDGNTVVVEPVG